MPLNKTWMETHLILAPKCPPSPYAIFFLGIKHLPARPSLRILLENVVQLWLQTSFLSLSFDHLDTKAKIQSLASILASWSDLRPKKPFKQRHGVVLCPSRFFKHSYFFPKTIWLPSIFSRDFVLLFFRCVFVYVITHEELGA